MDKLALCIIGGLSVLHSLCWTKTAFLLLILDGGTISFFAFLLSVVWLLGKLYTTRILGWEQEKLDRLLESLKKYGNAYPISPGTANKLENLFYIAIAFTFSTITLELSNMNNPFIEKSLLAASYQFSRFLFIWSRENLEEKSAQLKIEYGSELTVLTAAMGGIMIASEIISVLQTGVVLGLMMILAVALHAHVRELTSDIREFRGERRMEKVQEWKRCPRKSVEFWRKFRMIHEVFQAVHDLCGRLFKLFLLASIVALCVFMSVSFLMTLTPYYWILLVHLIFLEVWFIYAGKLSNQNAEICEWIRECAVDIGRVRVDGVLVDPRVILKKLEKKPIGFGREMVIIPFSFHYALLKMIGIVGDD